MGKRLDVDWKKVEMMYVTGTMSYKDLAEMVSKSEGVKVSWEAIMQQGANNNWVGKREAFRNEVSDVVRESEKNRQVLKTKKELVEQNAQIYTIMKASGLEAIRSGATTVLPAQVLTAIKDEMSLYDRWVFEGSATPDAILEHRHKLEMDEDERSSLFDNIAGLTRSITGPEDDEPESGADG
jgi:hypothetical protein